VPSEVNLALLQPSTGNKQKMNLITIGALQASISHRLTLSTEDTRSKGLLYSQSSHYGILYFGRLRYSIGMVLLRIHNPGYVQR
jgi:hypothetical protein